MLSQPGCAGECAPPRLHRHHAHRRIAQRRVAGGRGLWRNRARVTVTFSFEASTCPCFVRYDEAPGQALLADGIQAVSAGPDGCLRLWTPPEGAVVEPGGPA